MKHTMSAVAVFVLSACAGTAKIETQKLTNCTQVVQQEPQLDTGCVPVKAATPPSYAAPVNSHQQAIIHPEAQRYSAHYPESMWQAPPRPYRSNYQLLGNYVSRMASELVRNLHPHYYVKPIGVASFVNLDSTLERTNLAGNQIAEEFITEIRQLGLPVIDYKLTGHIRVTANGDFAFSRDAHQLRKKVGMNSVLTGTLVWHEGGLTINARIIDLETNAILAANKGHIPYFAADQIFRGPAGSRFYGYSNH